MLAVRYPDPPVIPFTSVVTYVWNMLALLISSATVTTPVPEPVMFKLA